jgi:hypothetical protein
MKNNKIDQETRAELLNVLRKYKQELHFKNYEDLVKYLEYLSKHEALDKKELDLIIL